MTDIEVVASSPMGLLEDLDRVSEAGALNLKGYSYNNIADIMDVTPYKAKQYVQEYFAIIQDQAAKDPYFLERIQENTLRFLKELDEISKEAWETVNIATENTMIGARTQALRLALDITVKKAQMLQLMGSKNTMDGDYVARLQKAERVNQMLAKVVGDIVSGCDRCKELARVQLAEAFAMMDTDDEVADAEVVED